MQSETLMRSLLILMACQAGAGGVQHDLGISLLAELLFRDPQVDV
jgi:hypothetical protein